MFPRQDDPESFFSYFSSYHSSIAAAAAASASQAAEDDQEDDQEEGQDEGQDEGQEGGFSTSVHEAAQSTSIGLSAPTTIHLAASTTDATAPALSSSSSTKASVTFSSPTDLVSLPAGSTPSLTISMIKTPPWQPAWVPHTSTTPTAASSTFTEAPANAGPDPSLKEKASDNRHSAVIAGVVVPIIVLLAGGLVFLACLRRRRRRRAAAATATSAAAAPGLVEKISHKRLNSDAGEFTTTTREIGNAGLTAPQRPPQPHLLISSPQNPTYFTGLDTFSVHSAATSDEPPPPYRARSVLSQRSNEPAPYSIALSPISPLNEDMLSPFTDNHAVPAAAVTRTPSTRSFASTLYSSNASVYEARPARRSVGAAHMVPGRPIEENVTSPFMDPDSESEGEGQGPRRHD